MEERGKRMRMIFEKDNTVRSIAFSLLFPVGSIYETKQNAGLTHLVEHLLFRGIGQPMDLYDFCERRGVYIHAKTGKNFLEISFFCRKEILIETVELIHKMLHCFSYTETDLSTEKKIILAELSEQEIGNHAVIMNRLWKNGKFANDILGNEKSLRGITLSKIIRFKKKMLSLDGAIFLFGNFDDEQREYIQALFSQELPLLQGKSNLSTDSAQKPRKEIKFICDDYDDCDVYYAFPMIFPKEQKQVGLLCMQMLQSVLFHGDTAYIKEYLREKQGAVYDVFSRLEIIENEAVLLFRIKTQRDELCSTVSTVERLLREFVFNERFLSYIKAFFCDNLELAYDNFKEYVSLWIDRYVTFGDSVSPKEQAEILKAVSLEEYNNVYRKMLKNKCFYCFGNMSKSDEARIRKLLK